MFTEKQINQMRFELEHADEIANIIRIAKENIKAEGKDFKEEYKKYFIAKGYTVEEIENELKYIN